MNSRQPYRTHLTSLVVLTALGAVSVTGCQKGDDDSKPGPKGTPAPPVTAAQLAQQAADTPELIQAMQKQDAAKASELIKGGADVNAKEGHGRTALIIAAGDNDRATSGGFGGGGGKSSLGDRDAMLPLLLSKHADPNAATDDGTTPLLAALVHHQTVSGPSDLAGTRAARMQKVKLLIAAGAKVNVTTRAETADHLHAGATPLMAAAVNGDPDLVNYLIAKGAEINAKDQDGNTALIEAAHYGNPDAVQALLAKHADVNVANAKGATALSEATRMKSSSMVKCADMLRSAGAK